LLRDISGNRNNGTITGATYTRLPRGLTVLTLDGTDDTVEFANSTSLNIAGSNLTIEAWLRPHISDAERAIVCKGATAGWTHKWGMTYGAVENKFRLIVNTVTGGETLINTTNPFPPNSFYHVVGVYNGATKNIYVNGVLDNSEEWIGGNLNTVAESLWLGHLFVVAKYDGDLGLLRVAPSALTATQVAGRYNQTRHLFGV
jgi:hypothetical protein